MEGRDNHVVTSQRGLYSLRALRLVLMYVACFFLRESFPLFYPPFS